MLGRVRQNGLCRFRLCEIALMSCARAIEWHFAMGCADRILDAAGHRGKLNVWHLGSFPRRVFSKRDAPKCQRICEEKMQTLFSFRV
jgi:hypothetical protein